MTWRALLALQLGERRTFLAAALEAEAGGLAATARAIGIPYGSLLRAMAPFSEIVERASDLRRVADEASGRKRGGRKAAQNRHTGAE